MGYPGNAFKLRSYIECWTKRLSMDCLVGQSFAGLQTLSTASIYNLSFIVSFSKDNIILYGALYYSPNPIAQNRTADKALTITRVTNLCSLCNLCKHGHEQTPPMNGSAKLANLRTRDRPLAISKASKVPGNCSRLVCVSWRKGNKRLLVIVVCQGDPERADEGTILLLSFAEMAHHQDDCGVCLSPIYENHRFLSHSRPTAHCGLWGPRPPSMHARCH